MEEIEVIWKDIPRYKGIYQVSNTGFIKSLARRITNRNGRVSITKEKILSPSPEKDGYLSVDLCFNGKQKRVTVHRIVGKIFIPNPLKLPEINHKDTIKTNNDSRNLEWCTGAQNIEHAIAHGLIGIGVSVFNCWAAKIHHFKTIADAKRRLHPRTSTNGLVNESRWINGDLWVVDKNLDTCPILGRLKELRSKWK